ncbi:MAG: hypothetical protein J2P15_14865 [Micromonosporaceae bacterium]|nr:hypothetical protein [Micromonosporaceae bacterium]
MTTEAIDEAVGRSRRADPVVGAAGGPAGNARLTAWTGAVLFVLLAIEGVTILNIRGLITWHLAIGIVLIPPVLLKTASTGWRILRYYTGSRPYRQAGPPPLPLRILGPLVVVASLAVLGSGTALIWIGPAASRHPLLGSTGRVIDAVAIHKATFVVWLGVTALHVLGRLAPALRLTLPASARVPGRLWRGGTILLTIATAAAAAIIVLGAVGPWQFQRGH